MIVIGLCSKKKTIFVIEILDRKKIQICFKHFVLSSSNNFHGIHIMTMFLVSSFLHTVSIHYTEWVYFVYRSDFKQTIFLNYFLPK